MNEKKEDWSHLCGESCASKQMPGYYKHGANLPGMMPNPNFLPNGKERYVLLHLGYAIAEVHSENAESHLRLNTYQLLTLCHNPNHIVGHVVEFRRQYSAFYLVVKVYSEVLVLKNPSQDLPELFTKIRQEGLSSNHKTQFEITSCS